jgi:hypothetical protein
MRMTQRLCVDDRLANKPPIREVLIPPGADGAAKLAAYTARYPANRYRLYFSTDCYWGGGHQGMQK